MGGTNARNPEHKVVRVNTFVYAQHGRMRWKPSVGRVPSLTMLLVDDND